MATFSQGFLSQLANPAMSQSLFDLGSALGGLPGQVKEQRRKQEQLKRYDQIAQMSEQGIASAQEGDVASLTSRIDQLQQARENAKTLEEKQAIGQSILKLQGLLPGAEKVSIGNNARELVNIDTSDEQSLQQKRKELMKDPRTLKQYQAYQMSQWDFEAAQTEVKSKEWLTTNSKSIDKAIQNNDTKALETIVQESGEFSPAAQTYINASLRNAESMAKFEENSIERKTAPSVDYYTKQVNNLPDELKKVLQPVLNAYSEAAESGWNEKTKTWSSGQLARAKVLEKRLKGDIRDFNQQVARSEYASRVSQDRANNKKIKELEVWIETTSSDVYRTKAIQEAKSLTERGEIPSTDLVNKIQRRLYETELSQKVQELSLLKGEEVSQEEEIKQIVSEFGTDFARELLKEDGYSENEISDLLKEKPKTETTFDGQMFTLPSLEQQTLITPGFLESVRNQK
jgi:hypothetical protein